MNKKKDNSTLKIVLITSAVIFVLLLIQIGSCVYRVVHSNASYIKEIKTAQATDAEIHEYQNFLDSNIELKAQEMKKYEDIIAQTTEEINFANDLEASQKYYELYNSKNWDAMDEDGKKLGEAYLAYANYYAAKFAKDNFLQVMKIPKVSRLLVKALIANNAEFQEIKKEENERLSE
ncbi:MAG: hypothetical protein FWG57_01705 [Endomicrobia bacterium]|nr:hypothetical protein [Endomicrobiia bacterium]